MYTYRELGGKPVDVKKVIQIPNGVEAVYVKSIDIKNHEDYLIISNKVLNGGHLNIIKVSEDEE